jgi:mannose-6-phosphate isomerase
MAAGYELTREPAYLDAVKKGADFLLQHFRDTEKGLFFYSTTPEGKVVNDSKDSNGLAFAIFALSHAARVTQDKRYSDAALETWAQMKEHLREENGLFRPKMDRNYTKVTDQNCQNPMMHLFEALLALHDATGSKAVLRRTPTRYSPGCSINARGACRSITTAIGSPPRPRREATWSWHTSSNGRFC